MFNLSDFYYYSPNGDITNSVQRQNLSTYNTSDPLWKRADDRFFWNKSLLDDLINSGVSEMSVCASMSAVNFLKIYLIFLCANRSLSVSKENGTTHNS